MDEALQLGLNLYENKARAVVGEEEERERGGGGGGGEKREGGREK